MSTITEQPEVTAELAQLVAKPDQTVLFMSRRSELRLVYKARYPMIAPSTGARIGETKGITVAFINGSLRVPREGVAKVFDPGGAGEADVPAADLLHWLETHRRNGDVNEGFWRVDPTAPPIERTEIDRLVQAATEWDIETLEAVLAQERDGWNRDDILKIAQGSIDRIRAMEERVKAEAAVAASEEVTAERQAREEAETQARKAREELATVQEQLRKAKAK